MAELGVCRLVGGDAGKYYRKDYDKGCKVIRNRFCNPEDDGCREYRKHCIIRPDESCQAELVVSLQSSSGQGRRVQIVQKRNSGDPIDKYEHQDGERAAEALHQPFKA